MEQPYAVEMLHITKRFPGIIANDDITLQLKKGEIHALLGENGAGKSTLMSVLFGLYQPEEGEIRMNGQPVRMEGERRRDAEKRDLPPRRVCRPAVTDFRRERLSPEINRSLWQPSPRITPKMKMCA